MVIDTSEIFGLFKVAHVVNIKLGFMDWFLL